MRRKVKITLAVTGAVIAALGALAFSVVRTVRSTAPIREDAKLDGVQVVRDRFVAVYLLDLAPGEVALVDAGADPAAKPILDALARRGLGADAVKAILLTHGDYDHVGGARAFPRAEVMVLEPDVALAEGRSRRGPASLLPAKPSGLKIARVLRDGEELDLSGSRIRVFAVPGHTAGSAAFLARGVLFLGDSAEVMKDGALHRGWWFTNDSSSREEGSLRTLAERLSPLAGEIRAIACAHSAVIEGGLAPLTALAARR